ncbi:MAG: hypothetical protein JW940_38850 [Polyangiaceae bacterium]|nr:hypothetical protein [Polyangiaceae bacterium]
MAAIPTVRLSPRATRLVNIGLPGLYAWYTTVAWPAASTDAPTSARLTCVLALVALAIGAVSTLTHPRAGAALGVLVFFLLCVATWLLLGDALDRMRHETLASTLGGVGWALFALGWGSVRSRAGDTAEPLDAIAGGLAPRSRLARGSLALFGLTIVASCALVFLGWSVVRPAHAVLGQTVAVASSVALLLAAGRLAVGRLQSQRSRPASSQLWSVARKLTLVVVLLGIGVLWTLLGGL